MKILMAMFFSLGFAMAAHGNASDPTIQLPKYSIYDNQCTSWKSKPGGMSIVPLSAIRSAARAAEALGSPVYLRNGHKHFNKNDHTPYWNIEAVTPIPAIDPNADDASLQTAVLESIRGGAAAGFPTHYGACAASLGTKECVGWAMTGGAPSPYADKWVPVTCDDVPPAPSKCSVRTGTLNYDFVMAPTDSKALLDDVWITCDLPTNITLRTEWDKGFAGGTNYVVYDNGDMMSVAFCNAQGILCDYKASMPYSDVTSMNIKLRISYKTKIAEVVRHLGTLYVEYN